jgi:hypothetical protein
MFREPKGYLLHEGAVDAPTTPSGQGRATPQGVELGAGHTHQPGSGDDSSFSFCHEDVDVVGCGRDAVRQPIATWRMVFSRTDGVAAHLAAGILRPDTCAPA